MSKSGRIRPVGFVGMGTMGSPMAVNILGAGVDLVVWNRSPRKTEQAAAAGAHTVGSVADLFRATDVVLFMLTDDAAVDEVVQRGQPRFADHARSHVLVPMGAHSPSWVENFERDVAEAGGRVAGCPMSGSEAPARAAKLVGLLGADEELRARLTPILGPMCTRLVEVETPADAFTLKLAINLFQTTLIAGLTEAAHFLDKSATDVGVLVDALASGPLASAVVMDKARALSDRDFTPHATSADAVQNLRAISNEATRLGVEIPVSAEVRRFYERAVVSGLGGRDLTGAVEVLEQ